MAFRSISPEYNSRPPYNANKEIRMSHCTACGTQYSPSANFCANCGANRAVRPLPQNQCPCGVIFGPQDKFCGSCGKPKSAAR